MTNAEARFNNSLRPRKPEGSLGRTAQDGHLDSHTALELCVRMYLWWSLCTLNACQVRVTVGESGLCCCTCVTSFERWLTPLCVVSILSNGAVLGETRAKSQVPSVSLCRAPRCVGNGVVAGLKMKMTSSKASAICVPMSGSKACW